MNRISFLPLVMPSVPYCIRLKRYAVSLAVVLFCTGLFLFGPVSYIVTPAEAQFYKYLDADGNIRFTDDLSQVPPEQREAIPSYTSTTSPADTAGSGAADSGGGNALNSEETPATSASGDGAPEGASPEELKKRREELKQRKETLDKEYAAIREEQKALTEYGLRQSSKYKAKEFLDKKAKLKTRVQAYEADRKAYEQAVADYNRSVEEEMVRQEQERQAADRAASMDNLYKGVEKKE